MIGCSSPTSPARSPRSSAAAKPGRCCAGGLNWPLDLTVGADGNLYVADGTYFYALDRQAGTLQTAGMLFSPGYPGFLRGVASDRASASSSSRPPMDKWRATDRTATKARCWQTVSISSTASRSRPSGSGRGGRTRARDGCFRIRAGRRRGAGVRPAASRSVWPSPPTGVAWSPRRALGGWSGWTARVRCWTDCSVRRAFSCSTTRSTSSTPAPKELVAFDLGSGTRRTIASELPVGAPPGVIPKPLLGMPPFSGPQGPFAGIAAGPDGTCMSPPTPRAACWHCAGNREGQQQMPNTRDSQGRRPPLPAGGTRLRKEIVDGVYPVGSQLPTEHELCERFAVSRYTIREALRRLRDDNLVSSRPRTGTLVVPRPSSDSYVQHVMSINDLLAFATGTRVSRSSPSRWSRSTTSWPLGPG